MDHPLCIYHRILSHFQITILILTSTVDSRKMELLDQRMRGFQNMKEKEPTDNADISATNEINDFEYEIPMKSNDSDEVTKEVPI